MQAKVFHIVLFLCLFTACSTTADIKNQKINTFKTQSQELQQCGEQGVWLQVLGSGGPELDDGRASSSYLLWVNGRARVLVDAGGGSALNFEKTKANFNDIELILLSHLHVDHSADIEIYIKASFFADRKKDLTISGPTGNDFMPATDEFINNLFAEKKGAYRYLSDYLPESKRRPAGYQIQSQVYSTPIISEDKVITASAISVQHGALPALAWRLDIDEVSIVFSGDMASGEDDFIRLLDNSDMFVAHNAVPEEARGVARFLHMPPSVIAEYVRKANVGSLLLSHRMQRTLGKEQETLDILEKQYKGTIAFANDLDCYPVLQNKTSHTLY